MQAWWAEENSLENIKNLTVQKLLTGSEKTTPNVRKEVEQQ